MKSRIKGQGPLRELKVLFAIFISNLLSIWTYRNKEIVNKEPLFATNVVKLL